MSCFYKFEISKISVLRLLDVCGTVMTFTFKKTCLILSISKNYFLLGCRLSIIVPLNISFDMVPQEQSLEIVSLEYSTGGRI